MIKVHKSIRAKEHKEKKKKASTYALMHFCTYAPKRGFSLLELIIAIAVLAIGLVGVLQIFPVGLRASYRAGMLTKAAFLAQNKMEEVKMAGFEAVTALPPKIPLSGTEGDFDWGIFIDEVDLGGLKSSEDLRKVIVTISWIERNRTRTKDFVTYVTH